MSGTVHDVTERRLADERMAALLELGDRLRSAQSREDIAAAATELLGRTLNAARAGYAVIDAAARHMSIANDWTDGSVASITGTYPWAPFAATMARLSAGRTLAVADVTLDPELASDREAFAAIGVKSQIQVPLIVRGVLAGVLFVQSRAPREWNALELTFAEGVADRTHAAIAQLQAEDDRKLLNHELGHRLKNMLAMIMAIAAQTLRKVPERAPIEAFERRLMALGSAHDILLQNSWSSARISSIVDGAIELLGQPHRVDARGANLTLGPRAALGLTLILHELGTNALKYGALSVETGHVAISWSIKPSEADPALIVTWRETGGPPAEPPDGKGFGSRLISLGILGTGGVATHYSAEGFVAEFTTSLRLAQRA
jgi:two-component sensor histidine kinase